MDLDQKTKNEWKTIVRIVTNFMREVNPNLEVLTLANYLGPSIQALYQVILSTE